MNTKALPRNELRISITSLCNMKCVYCHNEGNHEKAELSVSLIKKLVETARKFGLKSVRLTGGEPLLHNEIIDICRAIKEVDEDIQIGINTNGILIDKLLLLIDKNYVDRVVVGIDYFDAEISKNSCIGVPSSQILNNILKIKSKNIKVEIAKTYNEDLENTILLTEWAMKHDIPIKIIEIVDGIVAASSTSSYLEMKQKIIEHFLLEVSNNENLNEDYVYRNEKKMISFFQSHCRLRECEFCKNLHMRVTSDKKFKPCLLNNDTEISFNEDSIEESLIESLNYLGVPPEEK